MKRRRPLTRSTRTRALTNEERVRPLAGVEDLASSKLYLPGKHIDIGDRVFPFGGLILLSEKEPTQIRWNKDGGGWNTISIGTYTDILSAAKFYSTDINEFGTYNYELEITLPGSEVLTEDCDVVCGIQSLVKAKVATQSKTIMPFSDFIIAYASSHIQAINYSYIGAASSSGSISRRVFFTGSHSAPNNSSQLQETDTDFEQLGIELDVDIVKNTTDNSEGVVAAFNSSSLNAPLAGGTDNDWDISDGFSLVDGRGLNLIAKAFEYTFSIVGFYIMTMHAIDNSTNVSTAKVALAVNVASTS
jgi:hypothetical protein